MIGRHSAVVRFLIVIFSYFAVALVIRSSGDDSKYARGDGSDKTGRSTLEPKLKEESYDVKHCNTATSRLIGTPGEQSCVPRWPDLFGGPDGSDILFCGGSVIDRLTGSIYTDRLPTLPNIIGGLENDPRLETVSLINESGGARTVFRWECVDNGAVDYMGNPYITTAFDRLRRTRNTCAKHIYRAVPQIKITEGRATSCDCLSGHGKMHIHSDEWFATANEGDVGSGKPKDRDGHYSSQPPTDGIVSLPHVCSPCKAGGGLDNGEYTVTIARGCVKSFHKTDESEKFETPLDSFPCGERGFNSRGVSCSAAVVYVGLGLSEFGRRLVGRKTLQ